MSAFDAAIMGGGVSAWACAAALAEAGLSCAVMTRRGALRSVGEYLPPEGIAATVALGLGGLLTNPAHRRCPGTLSLWGAGAPLRRDVLMQPGGRAFCLDRTVFERDLQARAGMQDVGFRGLPAGSQRTEPACGPGWAAIGDAAMAFDPLASAGLTKALLDIREVMPAVISGGSEPSIARADRHYGYRRELAAAYRSETRFDGPFWARRRAAPHGALPHSS